MIFFALFWILEIFHHNTLLNSSKIYSPWLGDMNMPSCWATSDEQKSWRAESFLKTASQEMKMTQLQKTDMGGSNSTAFTLTGRMTSVNTILLGVSPSPATRLSPGSTLTPPSNRDIFSEHGGESAVTSNWFRETLSRAFIYPISDHLLQR